MGVSGTDGLTLYGLYYADDSSTIVTGGESVFRKEKKEINYDDDFEESA